MIKFCKRKKFFIKTHFSKDTYNFCGNIELLTRKVESIKEALKDKHDSVQYAEMLFNEVNRHMLILIEKEYELIKENKTYMLESISAEKFEKFSNTLAVHYIPENKREIFKQQPEVSDMVNYTYHYTMMKLMHDKSFEKLNNVNLNLIQELEPLMQYKDIKNCVNAMQYLMSKLYEMRDRMIKMLKKDWCCLYQRNRIAKCVVLKNFRKVVHQMN